MVEVPAPPPGWQLKTTSPAKEHPSGDREADLLVSYSLLVFVQDRVQSLLIVPMDFRAGNAHNHLKGFYTNIEGAPSPVLEFKKTAPPPSGLARLNGKEWKVVVAARQYPGSSFLARGFGDLDFRVLKAQ